MSDKKKPTAQQQVGNRVNSGLMTYMCQEDSDKYEIGFDIPDGYAHVIMENEDNDIDMSKYVKSILKYMDKKGYGIKPYPKIKFDNTPQNGLFIKTGYYDPDEKKVVIFSNKRHEKDQLRSLCHELIHHQQNLRGDNLSFNNSDAVKDNKELEKIESEAYLKGNIAFRSWTEYFTHGKNKEVLNENFDYENIGPNSLNLSSFRLKNNLNPEFWKDGHLDSRIRIKLLDIADDFIDTLNINWLKPSDIVITGSLSNYNWSKLYSDIDLHIIYDFSEIDERTDFVKEYFDSKKKLWNEEHDNIKIYGFSVEVYVQDENEEHTSNGIYSIEKDEWIIKPERKKLNVNSLNNEYIKKEASNYMDMIDNLIEEYESIDNDAYEIRNLYQKSLELFKTIKNNRKYGFSKTHNELNNYNIIFKILRRTDYISKLIDLINELYDKNNSLY